MSEHKEQFKADKISIRQFLGIYKGVTIPWLFLLGMVVMRILSAKLGVYTVSFTGDMVDASGNVPVRDLVLYAISSIIMTILTYSSSLFSDFSTQRINCGVRGKLWKKMLCIKQSSYDEHGAEEMVSRLTNDCENASRLFTEIVGIFSALQMSVIYFREMYTINITISLWVLLLIPLELLITWAMSVLRSRYTQRNQTMLAGATQYLIERTRNLLLIKACCAENEEEEVGISYFKQQYNAQMYAGLIELGIQVVLSLLDLAATLIPFAVGAVLVANGEISVGDVIMIYSYSSLVGSYFGTAGTQFSYIAMAAGGLSKVNQILEAPQENIQAGEAMDIPDQDLYFKNVTFAYKEKEVLKNITCEIPKNKVTAIIGKNGSGKSTLFKLAERLYEPKSGILCFGENDASEYSLQDWRRSFGIVSQNCLLMEGTIRENLLYGCQREVTDEEIENIAKQTHVYDFVKDLPDGMNTKVEHGGKNLSGGQKQCIAIARVIMRNPNYLLLDEATSNLDAKSEQIVTDALRETMRGRTTVMIAHSISDIRNVDHVIVLKDGQVEMSGSPQEILQTTDNYLQKVMGRRKFKTT